MVNICLRIDGVQGNSELRRLSGDAGWLIYQERMRTAITVRSDQVRPSVRIESDAMRDESCSQRIERAVDCFEVEEHLPTRVNVMTTRGGGLRHADREEHASERLL